MKYAALMLIVFLMVMSSTADDCDPCPTPESTPEVEFDSPYIRIWNQNDEDFEAVTFHFESETVDYGDIAANTVSQFYKVDKVYEQFTPITLTVDGEEFNTPAADFTGAEPLEPGYYTYILNLEDGEIQQELLKPVLSLDTRGGLCPEGECSFGITLYDDGTVAERHYDVTETGTSLEPEEVEAFIEEIAELDFEELRSQPFEDLCPTAYDGSEAIFSFYTDDGVEILSTCEFVFDESQPPFVMINGLMMSMFDE